MLHIAWLLGLLSFRLFSQTPPVHGAAVPTIEATGEALATAKPDIVRLVVGVVSEAETAEKAGAENAKRSTTAISELRRALGPDARVETVSYSVAPVYRRQPERPESSPQITGFMATNLVQVNTPNVANIGSVIDSAMRAGANRIDSLQFDLKDQRKLELQALRQAALNARQQADELASALRLKVLRVVTVTESRGSVRPLGATVAFAERAGTTPIEPAMVKATATVTLTVEVSP